MADVSADLEKLLQSGSLNNHAITEKLFDDIGSKYRSEQQSLQNLEFQDWENLPVDSLGECLIPTDLPDNLKAAQAKKATGDGNCLYHSGSIILNGNEDFTLLLRLLTAAELYGNASFYANHPTLAEAASHCGLPEVSLFIQCLSESGLKVFESTRDRVLAVKGEAIAGCRDRKWSTMMHLMALSTVMGRPIFSLYPECNTNTRPLSHRKIVPRNYATKKPDISVNMAMVLWSRDSDLDNRPGSWYQPNHFVPVFEVKGKPPPPLTTAAPDKDHPDGVHRRKRQKIIDFFGSKNCSPQPRKKSTPPEKKQRLEEDEGNPPPLQAKHCSPPPRKKRTPPVNKKRLDKDEGNTPPQKAKQKYETKRERKFQPHWRELYSWVEHDAIHDIMFCKVCYALLLYQFNYHQA